MNIGHELLNVPIDRMIESMASGIANAQYQLDKTALSIAQLMGSSKKEHQVAFGEKQYSLLELGLTPTFYQFVDSVIEVKMAISIRSSVDSETRSSTDVNKKKKKSCKAYTSSVNASYSARYDYSAEGSSLLRTKIVPVPPPQALNRRIAEMLEQEQGASEDQKR